MAPDTADEAAHAATADSVESSLPLDLLQRARRRVSLGAAALAGVWAAGLVVANLLAHSYPGAPGLEAWPMPGTLVAGLGVALSLFLATTSRRLYERPKQLVVVLLAFEVAMAALVAFLTQWRPIVSPGRISWVCVVILAFAGIVAATPARTLAASLVAASMDPLFFWIAWLRGVAVDARPLSLLWMVLPNYYCAVLSIVPAYIVRALGRQVRKARELGGYRLGPVLGSGGMGQVHRAEHRMLSRPAAIKVIRPELLGTGQSRHIALERFKREARAAASLRSPHTIDLFDFGVTADGTFYYAMELLDGISFEALVERFGPVSAERAIHLMCQACDSIAEAHARNLIHRDLKPSNLLTSRMGLTVDFVKVLDFGLVKLDAHQTDRPPTLTAPDIATGTPAFMAPEVALGERKADHRLDIYSLGCVLYWLLTGRLVFEGENAVKMMHQHISDTPAPPSRRTELAVPAELDEIVMACLAKKPADRPANATDLAERLAAVPCAEPWTPQRALRWWDTHLPERKETAPFDQGTLVPQVSSE